MSVPAASPTRETALASDRPGFRLEVPEPLLLDCGVSLGPYTIAYQTYGNLNAERSNAILICHALTGDQYVAEPHPMTGKPGWWETLVGPGKVLDTGRYFLICANVLGGCMGSTGPMEINPETGKPWGLSFPVITVADMVRAQKMLIDHLGIETLFCVTGGSMGGMQVLQWAASFPERVFAAVPIATAARHSAQNIAFHEVGRQAIMADPEWRGGNYLESGRRPARGLAVARMAAHITYLSEQALHRKFGRSLQNRQGLTYGFDAEFQVENYLRHQDAVLQHFLHQRLALPDGGEPCHRPRAQRGRRQCELRRNRDRQGPRRVPARGAGVLRHLARLPRRLRAPPRPQGRMSADGSIPSAAADSARLRGDLRLVAEMIEPGARVLDIGCGDGELLAYLAQHKRVDGRGMELSQSGVNAGVRHGLSVIQGDADHDLQDYPSDAFDYAVLSQTLQATHQPRQVLEHLVRIGRRAIVSFPNFGHWRIRLHLLAHGRMPVTPVLAHRWYDTPNIHLCTILDFVALCEELGIVIERSVTLDRAGLPYRLNPRGTLAKLLAEQALFLLRRARR